MSSYDKDLSDASFVGFLFGVFCAVVLFTFTLAIVGPQSEKTHVISVCGKPSPAGKICGPYTATQSKEWVK